MADGRYDQAFPVAESTEMVGSFGMTQEDWLLCMVLQGMLNSGNYNDDLNGLLDKNDRRSTIIIHAAYDMVDRILEVRKKRIEAYPCDY